MQAGTEPFHADGGPVGALVLHGFTGSPASTRPWAEHLAAAGLTVTAPRLPGHGTRWQELNLTRWPDWYAEAERAFLALRARCDVVVAMGLSVGGCLALRLAEERGDEVAGLVVVNPSLATTDLRARLSGPLSRVVPSMPGVVDDIKRPGVTEMGYGRLPTRAFHSLRALWALTVADLGRVHQPLLVLRSAEDHVVEPLSARLLLAGVSSTDVEEVVLPDSYHVATLDNDAPTIFDRSLALVRRLAPTAEREPA
ncbi:MAG: alpha/beta hydrolase [Frankiaceae bacterium]